MCSPRGKYVAVEVKTDSGVLSEEQREFLAQIDRQGGEWQVVRSLEDARGLVERLRA